MLSTRLRSFVFLGDRFLLASTLEPPALLVYSLEQRPAGGTTQDNTHLLRFLFGTHFKDGQAEDILLTSDPSPGWSPSAVLQVPFHIADDERIIAMNVQYSNDQRFNRVFKGKVSLIPIKTLLEHVNSLLIQGEHDVGWDLYGPLLSENAPSHGTWDVWACKVFGMRYVLPRVLYLKRKPMVIIHDLCPRRYLRASEEERKESNMLYEATLRGHTGHTGHKSYPRSILKSVPLPEGIGRLQSVILLISEDGIVVREPVRHRKHFSIAARLMRSCRHTMAVFTFNFLPVDELD